MTDIIRTAARILKDSANKDDYNAHGLIAVKEADGDYNFFVNSLNSYINVLQKVIAKLVEEHNESTGIIPNCIVHSCHMCKIACDDKRQEGKVCGCFTYPDKNKQLYVVK